MANDAEWVEDVKRWSRGAVPSGARLADAGSTAAGPDAVDEVALGYEAAQPALQARHWPDAPTTDR